MRQLQNLFPCSRHGCPWSEGWDGEGEEREWKERGAFRLGLWKSHVSAKGAPATGSDCGQSTSSKAFVEGALDRGSAPCRRTETSDIAGLKREAFKCIRSTKYPREAAGEGRKERKDVAIAAE